MKPHIKRAINHHRKMTMSKNERMLDYTLRKSFALVKTDAAWRKNHDSDSVPVLWCEHVNPKAGGKLNKLPTDQAFRGEATVEHSQFRDKVSTLWTPMQKITQAPLKADSTL